MMPANSAKAAAALEVVAVSHLYGRKRALNNVSFTIAPGSFTVLLGLNGAGKTTLFSLISHLYDTRKGTIRIFGHDIVRAPGEALRRLGIVFQARTLDLDLTVRQNLSYHAALHGIAGADAKRRIATQLEEVEMGGRLNDKAHSLSGGQMRRVEIARALLHEPPLLLLDEATVGLDVQSRAAILASIRRLVATRGISVFWATHLIDEVEPTDDVVVLSQGTLVANGRIADVVKQTGSKDIGEAFAKLSRKESAITDESFPPHHASASPGGPIPGGKRRAGGAVPDSSPRQGKGGPKGRMGGR